MVDATIIAACWSSYRDERQRLNGSRDALCGFPNRARYRAFLHRRRTTTGLPNEKINGDPMMHFVMAIYHGVTTDEMPVQNGTYAF